MRTLKKTLALVLVLAMMFSLCVTASAADFEDAAEIENAQAVSTLVGLGVIEGMPDGSFDPAGTLTRAQAAKIIAYLLGVGEYAADGAATGFSDVPATHWASGYIAYCVEAGIIDGYGDGKFGPSDTLTGYQWSKMLLCAAGFDSDIEGYTGSAWQVNVAKDAITTNLWKGSDAENKAGISRDDACQYAYNTLMGKTYTYSPALVAGQVVYTLTPGEDFDTANLAINVVADATKTDALGRPIVVVTGDDKTTSKDDAKPAVYYTGAVAPVLTYTKTTKLSAVAADLGLSGTKAAKLDNAEITRATTGNLANSGNGVTVEVYVAGEADAKGVVPYTTVTVYEYIDTLAKADIIEAKAATATTDEVKAAIKLDGVEVAYETADFAEKDVVIYNIGVNAEGKKIALNVAEADVVTGKVTAKGEGYVKVDGTKYELAAGVSDTTTISATASYNFYLDSMGYIKLIVPVVAESEVTLAYVVDFYSKYIPAEKDAYGQTVEGTDVTEWYAQALDMDGKEVTYKVAAADASVKGDVVKVVYNTTTKLYSFAAATGYAFETDAIEYSATAQPVSFTADGVAYYYDAAKYFNVVDSLADLVVEAGSVKVAADETVWVVYTGKTANKTVTTVFYSDEASLTPDADILKGLYATGAAYSETTKINHLDKDGKVTATPDVYTYEVYLDGVKTEIQAYASSIATGIYAYSVDKYGIYEIAEAPYAVLDQVSNVYGNYVTTVGELTDVDLSAVEIVDLSKDADKVLEVGEFVLIDTRTVAGKTTYARVYIVDVAAANVFAMANFNATELGYDIGWTYTETVDVATITAIEVGMKDANGKLIVKYTADVETAVKSEAYNPNGLNQIAWQQANGYVTELLQSSAPMMKIDEVEGEDWTVIHGDEAAFAAFTPATCYVSITMGGNTYTGTNTLA